MGEDFPQVFYAVVYKIDKVYSRFRTEKKERKKERKKEERENQALH